MESALCDVDSWTLQSVAVMQCWLYGHKILVIQNSTVLGCDKITKSVGRELESSAGVHELSLQEKES